jgi:hypothetical protein
VNDPDVVGELHRVDHAERIALELRIPLKAISDSGGKAITIPETNRSGVGAQRRWHFDVAKTDRNRQAESVRAKRRQDGRGEDGGVGQGAAIPCPASARSSPGA